MKPVVYTAAEVAEIMGCSKGTVYNMVNSGRLSAIRFGPKLIRIPVEAVEALLANPIPIPATDSEEAKRRREKINMAVSLARIAAARSEN